MELFFALVFWSCLFLLLHSYLLYPLLLRWLAKGKQPNRQHFTPGDNWPRVSVLMAAYNEEKVIRQKLESLLGLDYPEDKLFFFIGSDCSNDQTDAILRACSQQHAQLRFIPFKQRQGKPGVINQLSDLAQQQHPLSPAHIFVITDASVMQEPPSLKYLVRHFKNPDIDIVDAHLVHVGMKPQSISRAEGQYISNEVKVKYLEGLLWGKMIGPFGACYALRSNRFVKVPPAFLVDDFYITMKVFEQGGQAINDLEAICYEAVSHEIKEEYRRKSRISAGNFQNLFTFPHLWWPPARPLQFAFFSHKVLRWFGPFFLILMLLSSGLLSLQGNIIYKYLFAIMVMGVFILPLMDVLLRRFNIDILPLRGARYFFLMNLALLEGFFKYINGIRSNVWEPTKRN